MGENDEELREEGEDSESEEDIGVIDQNNKSIKLGEGLSCARLEDLKIL